GTYSYTFLTHLWKLDKFATSVLGYPIDIMFNYMPGTQPETSLYKNKTPKSINMDGKTVFTGDVLASQNANSNNNNNNSSNDDDGKNDSSSDNPPAVAKPQPASTASTSDAPATKSSDDHNGDSKTDGNEKGDEDEQNNDKTDTDKVTDDSSISNTDGSKDSDEDSDEESSDDNSNLITMDEVLVQDENGSMYTETIFL
ncbi:hypothetical protein LPJ56_005644, partial [Coemansia sp. RSA 2599]